MPSRLLTFNLILTLSLVACTAPVRPATESPALGSSRGSVVAIDPATIEGPLVYLSSARQGEQLEQLRAAAPGVEIIAGLDRRTALEHAERAHGVDAHLCSEEFLAAADQLVWVQAFSAGVERYLAIPGLVEREGLVFTNAQGVHGPVIAEHVFALLLSMTRRLGPLGEAQADGRWDRRTADGSTALAGRTLLVAGMGGIGSEVARRAHGFDMRVLATVRSDREAPAYVDELGTAEDLDRFLAASDVLVICLPLTDQTRGLFDAQRLALLRPGAYLINIGRGPIVDTDALVAALDSGHLSGAGLDVTDPEPLPAGHPLWSRDDVVITPHCSSRAELTGERRDALVLDNMRRFGAGEPLLNVVNRAAGY